MDDGPGSAKAAQNEANAAKSMKARGPDNRIPGESETIEVPLPEDFEAEYAEEITEDNYEAELDALETALDGE